MGKKEDFGADPLRSQDRKGLQSHDLVRSGWREPVYRQLEDRNTSIEIKV
jgi:hypothetical protein